MVFGQKILYLKQIKNRSRGDSPILTTRKTSKKNVHEKKNDHHTIIISKINHNFLI